MASLVKKRNKYYTRVRLAGGMVDMLHEKKIRDTKKKIKESTINIRIRSVNAFTNWLFQQGNILGPIEFKQIKLDEQQPKFLTPAGIG